MRPRGDRRSSASTSTAFHEADEPPVRRPEPVDGPAIVADSTFAPSGDRLPALGWRAAAPRTTASPSGGSSPPASSGAGRTRRATRSRSTDCCCAARTTSSPRSSASWADCDDLHAATSDRRSRGQPRPRRSGRRDRAGCRRRAGRGVRRAPGGRRARAGRRGASRHPARGSALRRPGHQAAGRLLPGARCSGPSAGCTARSRPASSSATPTRATTGSSGTAWSATG